MTKRIVLLALSACAGVGLVFSQHAASGPGPDQPLAALITTDYDEQITGQTWFGREEVSIVVEIDPHELEAGKYWLEMHMLSGDEQFFQMERSDVTENSYWVDYEDFGGLQPSQEVFGTVRDLPW